MTGQDDAYRADRVRGFPAFAARKGSSRGQSWWGRAWLTAMEDTSLDPEPLKKGRAYARAGHVGSITLSPGRIAAPVHDGHQDVPYRTVVLVERLDDSEWARFLEQVAAKAGHIAALLDRDMPHDLVEAAEDAGVRLLPGPGDLEPECDCDSWDHPCKHAAALCYQASWLLDQDPFVLLLLRGRGERELLDELQQLSGRRVPTPDRTPAPVPVPAPSGETAEEVYARAAVPLPGPLAAPPAAEPVEDGDDPLARLVADAAERARELLRVLAGELESPPPPLDRWQDAVRIAAARTDPQLFARLQAASGRPTAELERAAQAWRLGGRAGLDTLETAWTPPQQALARARAELASAWESGELPELQSWRNRWTVVGRGLQLRYGQDGRWYPYRAEGTGWWPVAPPERDSSAALAALLLDG